MVAEGQSGTERRSDPGALLAGALVVVGAVVVVAATLVESVQVGGTTVDLFLVGGSVFTLGFLLAASVRILRGDRVRGTAQMAAALGWGLVIWGTVAGAAGPLYAGVGLLVVGGAILVYEGHRSRSG